jgi:membrane protein DedA with SNARE-associated domain
MMASAATFSVAHSVEVLTVTFLAVVASWAGVPAVGGIAAGTAGALASQGKLNLLLVVVVVTIAGETGGLLGYEIGFRWGRRLVERPGKHQRSREKALAGGERLYAKWGRLAVFVTPAMVSGTAKMRFQEFAIWNFFASLGFALFTVAGAYGVGRLVTGHNDVLDIMILVIGLVVGSFLYFLTRHLHRRREERIAGG